MQHGTAGAFSDACDGSLMLKIGDSHGNLLQGPILIQNSFY